MDVWAGPDARAGLDARVGPETKGCGRRVSLYTVTWMHTIIMLIYC